MTKSNSTHLQDLDQVRRNLVSMDAHRIAEVESLLSTLRREMDTRVGVSDIRSLQALRLCADLAKQASLFWELRMAAGGAGAPGYTADGERLEVFHRDLILHG